jgi:DNA-binding SARP family transcriptional activator
MEALDLRFRFLGGFAMRSDTEWRSGPPPKKGRELIQYLGAYPRRVATRDELAEAFWPSADVDAVAHRIHLAASGARNYLREMFYGVDVIDCVRGGYAWHPNVHIWSDVEELLSLCRSGSSEGFENAAKLYAGEFLAGEIGDWIHPLRLRCASAFSSAVDKLAGFAMEQRDYDTALSYGLQLVEAEPAHEGATRLVMQCFAALGQRARALERFASLCAYLEHHLGIGPMPETSALVRSIRESA